MRLFLLMSFVLSFSLNQSALAEGISDAELKEFGQKFFSIHENQDSKAYLGLIHPDCPSPDSKMLDWKFSRKWLSVEQHDIRIRNLEDAYDFSKVSFKVMPEAALGFQVWVLGSDGASTELVTGVPIARYKGDLKIVDYPCFDVK